MWLEEYERLLRDPAPNSFQAAVDLKARHRPPSVFKYRVVSNESLNSLRRGDVWLSRPRSFNDGYDSAMVVDHGRLMAISFCRDIRSVLSKRGLTEAFSEADIGAIVNNVDPISTFGALLLQQDEAWAGADSEATLERLASVRRAQIEDIERATFEMAQHTVLACCFSASGTAPALWAHYAGGSSGFCVEYDLAQLPPNDIRLRLLVPVIYGHAPLDATFAFEAALLNGPNPLTVRWPIMAASYKDRHWSSEQEWRLIDPCGAPADGNDGRALPMPMKAIYLGRKMCQDDAAKVRRAAQEHKLPVFNMQLGREASALTFVAVTGP